MELKENWLKLNYPLQYYSLTAFQIWVVLSKFLYKVHTENIISIFFSRILLASKNILLPTQDFLFYLILKVFQGMRMHTAIMLLLDTEVLQKNKSLETTHSPFSLNRETSST